MVAKERPILFQGGMVRAILEGRKTQTRRVDKRFPTVIADLEQDATDPGAWNFYDAQTREWTTLRCPYGAPGDRLWVRETFHVNDQAGGYCYRADQKCDLGHDVQRWMPSIHMPRAASRILLEVVDVRVERLQDITEDDASAEGVPPWANGDDIANGHYLDRPLGPEWCGHCQGEGLMVVASLDGASEIECGECDTARKLFRNLWDGINGPRGYGWEENPWCWVVEFRRAN